MNNDNTIVYVKVAGPRPANFVDPIPFEWNDEKESQLWKFISKLNSQQDHINWEQLSETFVAPVYFLKNRAYKMFSMRLEQLQQKIENKKKILEGNPKSESVLLTHHVLDSTFESSFLTPTITNVTTKLDNVNFQDPQHTEDDVTDQLVERLQTNKNLNYKTPETAKIIENKTKLNTDNESDSDISSSLSVSKSALEEALMARLNF
ncbi:Atg29p [Maudiozyma barnettii]|uniref:Autophagy-related protein 29 n=1 Tax=Maudiozyma barnettii TaxID=61262 RepID=A0A8H2VCH6_9SACH|nr:Atg29p [Kazachstania barnettii]CAB4252708.1 similar to Saccharomyces cerevisiae YPL166W ATG29 Autophagy-specific protein that is required for recruitment of other ATG proteins to the pre-autophagosomal structure (PAS) [Kazachstania barnettii]